MEEAQDGDITVVAGVRCDAWFGSVKAATVLCHKGYKASTCTLIVIVIGGLKSMGLTKPPCNNVGTMKICTAQIPTATDKQYL